MAGILIKFMASKKRFINTKFWSDNFISELDPLERYLFLYFLTNEHTNISGIYELPLRIMAFESGIDKEMILKMLPRLKEKILFIDGWIFIKNFIKNQVDNESVRIGIKNAYKDIPEDILAKISQFNTGSDTLPQSATGSDISKPEFELESKSKSREATPAQEAKDFFENPEPIIQTLLENGLNEQMVHREIAKFTAYWTERNKSGTKQRWEQQATFEVKRRLTTWFSKIKEFNQERTIIKL